MAAPKKRLLKLLIFRHFFSVACLIACSFVGAEEAPTYILSNDQTVSPLERFRECDVCPEMIVMPMGSFMMGAVRGESLIPSRSKELGAVTNIKTELPRHRVEMDIPFAIGRNEITRAEWMTCVEGGGCTYVPNNTVENVREIYEGAVEVYSAGPNHPVFNVSYLDVQEYISWLNEKVGDDTYRLPTEAEWEYAARAGTKTRFAQGDMLTSEQANFSGVATESIQKNEFPSLTSLHIPVPIHQLNAANSWGIRHMSGNVSELTLSCRNRNHSELSTDSAYLLDALSQGVCRRIAKGGSFRQAMDNLRLARRMVPFEETRRDYFGFRLIRRLRQKDDNR